MYQENDILEKTKWVDTLLAIAIALLLTMVGAAVMRWIEIRYSLAHAETINFELIEHGQNISTHIYGGYIPRNATTIQAVEITEFIPQYPAQPSVGTFSRTIRTLFGIKTAVAAELPTYSARLVAQSHESIRALPGRAFTMTVEFKNTGSATWTNTGDHFIALNVSEPAGRTSPFRHAFWTEYYYRATRLQQASVKPGEIGRFVFAMQVPNEPGRYLENFALVAEDLTWISGGNVAVAITIPEPYQAQLVQKMSKSIQLEPGQALTYWADFKNTGSATWTNTGDHFIALNVSEPAGRTSPFRHAFWTEYYYRATRLQQASVKPGEIGRFVFAIQAPTTIGSFIENFGLVAEDLAWVAGGNLRIPIQVGDTESLGQSDGEPTIRVGLTSEINPVEITANGTYSIKTSSGTKLATIDNGAIAKIRYQDGTYTLKINGSSKTTKQPLRFVPAKNAILEVKNFINRPGWNPDLNDNKFRGVIEVRFASATGRLWVINELPLEAYLRGIAETSNASPVEFQKALIIAARSYAYYHIQTGTKHKSENFTVDSRYDQVYRGYGFEQRTSKVVAAVKATTGQVVTYDDKPVITPYYSHSDGRTRSWEDVWGGTPKPWLVSVPDPWCAGMTLYGHGVGLSARGAIGQANEGKTAAEILKYYYTGTELSKLY